MSEPDYQHQQALIETLNRAWDYNADILRAHGYIVTRMGAPPITQEITEPSALEAYRVISAIHQVWESLFTNDKYAIANAALWLGIVSCGQYYRKRQSSNRRGKREKSERRMEIARMVYKRLQCRRKAINQKSFHSEWLNLDPDIKQTTTDRYFSKIKESMG